jgi:hypothetical protein
MPFDPPSELKTWSSVYRLLFAVAILAILGVFGLDYYYDRTCPLVANEESGHIYPLFDKYHSRYVYVTKTEKTILPILICIGAGSLFCGVLVDLKRKRLNQS